MDPQTPDIARTSPQPRLLTYTEIPTAVDTTINALEQGPMRRYINGTHDINNARAVRVSQTIDFYGLYADLVHKGTIQTVEDGASIVAYFTPGAPTDTFNWLLGWAFSWKTLYKKAIFSTEQSKRRKELHAKGKQVIGEVLGARVGSMLRIGVLCTAPAKRGHGYASALVRSVIALADEQQRAVWLISSDSANERFYKSLGFETKREFLLGDDNPTWTEPPITIALMVREYAGSEDP